MRSSARLTVGGREHELVALPAPLDLDTLVAGHGPWHVELGFGKGRHLLQQAIAHPAERYLGIEVVSKYYRLLSRRATRRAVDNLVTVRAEAQYVLATTLPRAFANTLHIYFPDPWPKSRHRRRRLLDPATIDLVLGILRPGGVLCFATDFLEYGEDVAAMLETMPGLDVTRLAGLWPDGARTNYEAKYVREGRPILRLTGRRVGPLDHHPEGRAAVLAAIAPLEDHDHDVNP